MSLLDINFALLILYMTSWYIVGRKKQRLDVADTAWGGGFVIIGLSSVLFNPSKITLLMLLLTLLWGARLALHIWRRNGIKGPDPRYKTLSARWPKKKFWLRAYFSVFIVQAILVFIVSLPISLTALARSSTNSFLLVIGTTVWLVGFLFEAAADRQLKKFMAKPGNHGTVLQSGLWKYSRHPNYFGEILLWWGVSIVAFGAHANWLLLLGPLTISALLIFISGIPSVERRYKENAAYQEYARRTSILLPLRPRS